MAPNQAFETIMGLATTFGSTIGLVLSGILLVALLLLGLDRAQRLLRRNTTSAQ